MPTNLGPNGADPRPVRTDTAEASAGGLVIPDRARDALATGDTERAIRLTLAAELRRLAGDEMSYAPACRLLESRADAFDPPAPSRP
jgi:hypothetical protein